MKLKIEAEDVSSITSDLEITLGDYTILAGENNSGKTHLVSAISRKLEESGYKVIHIPAEEVEPSEKEIKNSAKGDPFYKIVEGILKPVFQADMFEKLIKDFQSSDRKREFLDEVNTILEEMGVSKKRLDIKLSKDDLKHDMIIKLVKVMAKDLYDSDIEDVEISEIGSGTKRMIVAALIQYYAGTHGFSNEDKIFIAFEEPEAHLHPSWKESLYASLLKISRAPNAMVLVTTHDPYFIELGEGQKIIQVYRNHQKKDATDIKDISNEDKLTFPSFAEINYIAFDVPSTDYLLQLYQTAKGNSVPGFKDKVIDGVRLEDIRNTLAHRTNSAGRSGKSQPTVTREMKCKSIEYLRSML